MENNLFESKIKRYKKVNKELKQKKKLKKQLKKDLEKLLKDNDLEEFVGNEGKVKFITQNRSEMNEDMLLRKLEELDITKPIITQKAIDEKVLESMAYNDEIDKQILEDCTEPNIIKYVRIF